MVDDPNRLGDKVCKWLRVRRFLRLAHKNSSQQILRVSHPEARDVDYWIDDVVKYNSEEPRETHPFVTAIFDRNEIALNDLIEKSVDINQPIGIRNSTTLLHLATRKGDLEKFNILIELKDIKINQPDSNGCTALHLSIQTPSLFHSPYFLRKLLEKGADINAADKNGMTPFHRICQYFATATDKAHSFRLFEILVAAGARVDLLDKSSRLGLEFLKPGRQRIILERSLGKHLQAHPDLHAEHTRMWALLVSRKFVAYLFKVTEPPCGKCKRKTRDCQEYKNKNFRKWLFVHGKIPK